MANPEEILQRLDKVKKTGSDKWLACCPSHDDRSPSLAIKYTDEKILLHCFAGCSVDEIVASLGHELSDLMPDRPQYQKGTRPPKFNKYELFDRLSYEAGILVIACKQLRNGISVSQDDDRRITQAESTIDSILKEVRS